MYKRGTLRVQAVHSNTDASAYNIIAVQLGRANTGADKYSSSNNANMASDNANTSPHTQANIKLIIDAGGPGKDYYHFADYAQLRYYPLSWLYVQYRQGLHTHNNRRGVILDDTRLDENDAGVHHVAVVGHYRGFSAGVYQFWKLEKKNEQRDDLTRVTVGYAF